MSSFRKRNVQKPVPGTRTSPQTGQVITSSGNPSLDVILGGGLPIGSICLIEEDKFVTYSKVLTKYFLAEGVVSQQPIFLGSLDDVPAELMNKLPRPLNWEELEEEKVERDGEPAKNGLRIAWRYNDLPLVNSEQTTAKIGHHFNLHEQMYPWLLAFAEPVLWGDEIGTIVKMESNENDSHNESEVVVHDFNASDHNKELGEGENVSAGDKQGDASVNADIDIDANAPGDENLNPMDNKQVEENAPTPTPESLQTITAEGVAENSANRTEDDNLNSTEMSQEQQKIFDNEKYLGLLKQLQKLLREDKFSTSAQVLQRNLCRVCITSLGSPLWYDENFSVDILKFLTVLRATVRSAMSVCFITMPMHLIAKYDESLVSKIRNLVDFSIELESFAGSERETNPAFQEYNGLVNLHKIAAINTLSAYMPETTDLAFRLHRKKFVIEKLHLPPELQENDKEKPTMSCSANLTSNPHASLDF